MITDLSILNQYIEYHHFKMEGLQDALNLMSKDCFMTKVDLSQAYYSVPVHDQSQPFMAFLWQKEILQFTRMCFGLASAPRLFTKLLRPVMAFFRKQGILIVVYTDDFLILSHREEVCRNHTQVVIKTLESLGFTINREKCIVEPTHRIEFLGMTLNSENMTVHLPRRKAVELASRTGQILSRGKSSTKELASLIGALNAIGPAYPMAPLFYRELQTIYINNTRGPTPILSKIPVPLSDLAKEELLFWVNNVNSLPPYQIQTKKGMVQRIFSDASLAGWGGHL